MPDPSPAATGVSDSLAEALHWLASHGDAGLTTLELAELLWLASRLPAKQAPMIRRAESSPAVAAPRPGRKAEQPDPAPPPPDPVSPEPSAQGPDPFAPAVFPAGSSAGASDAAEPLLPLAVLPDPAAVAELQATLPVRLAQAPPLGDRAELLRALRPLLRRRPDPSCCTLDEERTAEAWAETGLLLPVLRPARAPWFEEVLVLVDSGLSMQVWHGLARELAAVLASSQVFARVRFETLAPERLPRTSLSLQSGVLVLLLSDAVGLHWWDGRMFDALEVWCRRCPVVLLQLLPAWQWERTALSVAERVAVRNGQAAAANRRYSAERLDWWEDDAPLPRAALLPVIPLDHAALAPWSAVVMGDTGYACGGVALPEHRRRERLAERLGMEQPQTPQQRWDSFCANATPQAQRLLMVMATAPVLTLPVIGLLKEAKVHGSSTPLPIAEVLMSGMLQRLPDQAAVADPNHIQFALVPELADLLVARLTTADRLDVIRTVSALVERRWNAQIGEPSFSAVLLDPTVEAPEATLGRGLAHFAAITARLLETMPGDAARAFAERIRRGSGLPPGSPWPAAMVFEEVGFEAVQLWSTPELEAIACLAARFEELELRPISFRTALLKADGSVQPSGGSGWGFHEPLQREGLPFAATAERADPLTLTLVQLPAGRFLMGSPPDEPERDRDEGPQHEVELESFLISQTPISQAQWREVAGWQERPGESWGRELEPNPSSFQSQDGQGKARLLADETSTDDRPVEQVSWEEAMEFCNRLSQRTGRTYTLPSEAQWEYACRAGTSTPFHFGETMTPELANYRGTFNYANGPKGEYREQTTPVGMFPANAWGLQDMHGNVLEWCLDHWHETYEGAPIDGSAWLDDEGPTAAEDSEKRRLLRGGSWNGLPGLCRSACRFHDLPDDASFSVGFRVVCLPQGPSLNP